MSRKWFKEAWAIEDFVILDTETTGLKGHDQVLQIGIINKEGQVLLDSLIRPTVPISSGAARVHGITEEMVKDAPTIVDLYWDIHSIIEGKQVFVYNAPFDKRLLAQSCQGNEVDDLTKFTSWCDVMVPYADFWGDFSSYHGNNRWQSLTNACYQQEIEIVDAHSAVGDCLMTLELIKKLAGETDNAHHEAK